MHLHGDVANYGLIEGLMARDFPLHTIDSDQSEQALFADVRHNVVEIVRSNLHEQRYRRNEHLFFTNAENDRLYFIAQGAVRLYKLSENGQELTLWILGPGDCFGELALVEGMSHTCCAVAMTETWVGSLTAKELRRIVHFVPSLLYSLLKVSLKRQAEVQLQLEDFAFKSVSARLAGLLLRLTPQPGTQNHRSVSDGILLTHSEIASMLGAARATITRHLNQLQELGILELGRQRVLIRDRARLEQISLAGETILR
jgi:CRP/FNR family transcriptional regulator, cyclic AMP receptor protein